MITLRPTTLCLCTLLAAATFTAAPAARAHVPASTWSALQGREIVVHTLGGKRIWGKLVSVAPTSVAIVVPGGDTLMVDRDSVSFVRAAGDEDPPAHPLAAPAESAGPAATPPVILDWHEGDPIPLGYRKVPRRRTGLIVTGSVLFGTAWVASLITAGAAQYPLLTIPVAGPVVVAARSANRDSMTATFGILFAADAVLQAVGLGLLIYGAATSTPALVRWDVKEAKGSWRPVPMTFANGGVGLGIVGTM